jgi:acetyl esterase/lipase
LILFVHGGGWKRGDKGNATGAFKAPHFTAQGYAFASINYRLVPAATVEQQAADVAAAVAYVKAHTGALGVDARRIILMGHSAGAHLVALVGTDPRYLTDAGLSFADIAGVIPLDGAAYDVPAQTKDGPQIMQATYMQAFGSDVARQKSLSPFHHTAAPNAPAFLILHVDRDDGKRQSEALGGALEAAGTPVKLARVDGKGLQGHMAINRRLGDPAYPATGLVDDWLRDLFK